MRKEFKEHQNDGGIYKITNQVTGMIYIGSAKEFKTRAKQHEQTLLKQKHHNKHLQRSWNSHKPEDFIFEVMEVIYGNKLERTAREEQILKEYDDRGDWRLLFNFQKKPLSNENSCYSNTPEETYKRKSAATKKRMQDPEVKEYYSQAMKQRWEDLEYVENISQMAIDTWQDSEIREKRIQGMKNAFAKPEYKAKASKIHKQIQEQPERKKENAERTAKRWQDPEYTKRVGKTISKAKMGHTVSDETKDKLSKDWCFVSPDGEVVCFRNLNKFCLEHGLSQAHMCAVYNKKRRSHKGWTIPNDFK